MRRVRYALGALSALLSLIYCAHFLYYYVGLSGPVSEAEKASLGPVLLILAVGGLLCGILLLWRGARIFSRPRAPVEAKARVYRQPDNSDDGFDADAVVARYLATQSPEPAADIAPMAAAPVPTATAKPVSFGRRGR